MYRRKSQDSSSSSSNRERDDTPELDIHVILPNSVLHYFVLGKSRTKSKKKSKQGLVRQ